MQSFRVISNLVRTKKKNVRRMVFFQSSDYFIIRRFEFSKFRHPMSFHVSRFHVIKQFLRMLSNHALCSVARLCSFPSFFFFFFATSSTVWTSIPGQTFAFVSRSLETVRGHAIRESFDLKRRRIETRYRIVFFYILFRDNFIF